MITLLKTIDFWVQRILRYIAMTMFSILGILLIANISLRLINDFVQFLNNHNLESVGNLIHSVVTINSFYWFDEIIELSFAALVFYGAAGLWCSKLHFSVGDWISPRIKNVRMKHFYRLLILVISAFDNTFKLIFCITSCSSPRIEVDLNVLEPHLKSRLAP